jgi:hypothetical protein
MTILDTTRKGPVSITHDQAYHTTTAQNAPTHTNGEMMDPEPDTVHLMPNDYVN